MATAINYVPAVEPAIAGTRFFGDVAERVNWRSVVFSKLVHPRPRNVPFHEHEHSYFSLLLRGEYAEDSQIIAPMTVSFLPMGARHDGLIGAQGAGIFTVEIAETWLDGLGGERSPILQERGAMLWAGMRLFSDFCDNGTADGLLLEEMLAELAACAARRNTHRERRAPRWLDRVSERLDTSYAERLSLADLAANADVHPVHLERTFRKFSGCTMGRRLHHLRIRRACELLADPDRPLADIAVATGFSDQPHFTRVFRRLTGTTPAHFRSNLLALRRKSA